MSSEDLSSEEATAPGRSVHVKHHSSLKLENLLRRQSMLSKYLPAAGLDCVHPLSQIRARAIFAR